jgi:sodium-dependent dicarboxylate transporter 2/3/5
MSIRQRYLHIGIAILLGLGVFWLPRPEGTTFQVRGDPHRQLAASVQGEFRILTTESAAETEAGTYRLEVVGSVSEPGARLTQEARTLGLTDTSVEYVDGLAPRGLRFLAVLAALIFLFIVEPIPLEITAILIGVCLIAFDVVPLTEAWATYMHPVVVFIMCCLVLAIVMERAQLTKRLSHAIAKRAGTSVVRFTVLLSFGLGIGSCVLHDAAAAAIGIATMLPLMRAAGIRPHTNTARFMLLSLAFACSCGGMGTLVGGGRCMVAAAFLKELTGIEIGFLDWILFAFPIALVTVPAAIFIVYLVFRPDPSIKLPVFDEELPPLTGEQKRTIAILVVIFGLWLTKGLHGLDYSVTGMAGIAALVSTGALRWRDIHENLEWGTALFIFGGGICLGLAMASSGAASYFAHLFFPLVEGQGWLLLLAGVCVFGALVTNAMANVAAAALILPIVIPLAQLEGVDPRVLALGLACATSFAMLLVIGCPPNAIAYSYHQFRARDLTKAGLVATPALLVLLLVSASAWWSILGLL